MNTLHINLKGGQPCIVNLKPNPDIAGCFNVESIVDATTKEDITNLFSSGEIDSLSNGTFSIN